MKLELVVDRGGVPVGVVTAAADTAEVDLAEPALASIPAGVDLPPDVPVVADRAYDSDPLRDRLAQKVLQLDRVGNRLRIGVVVHVAVRLADDLLDRLQRLAELLDFSRFITGSCSARPCARVATIS